MDYGVSCIEYVVFCEFTAHGLLRSTHGNHFLQEALFIVRLKVHHQTIT